MKETLVEWTELKSLIKDVNENGWVNVLNKDNDPDYKLELLNLEKNSPDIFKSKIEEKIIEQEDQYSAYINEALYSDQWNDDNSEIGDDEYQELKNKEELIYLIYMHDDPIHRFELRKQENENPGFVKNKIENRSKKCLLENINSTENQSLFKERMDAMRSEKVAAHSIKMDDVMDINNDFEYVQVAMTVTVNNKDFYLTYQAAENHDYEKQDYVELNSQSGDQAEELRSYLLEIFSDEEKAQDYFEQIDSEAGGIANESYGSYLEQADKDEATL